MSRRWTQRLLVVCGVFGLLTCASLAHAARIEAIPGKKYMLNKELGPWMVMVASFQTTSEDGSVEEGKTPEQAADELVLELRQRGIPAYVHSIDLTTAPVMTQDSAGRPVRRKNLRQQRSIGVLAGNYKGIDDSTAQKTLKWLKAYNPKCLQDGVIFEKTEKRPTLLAGAFMTINPLIPPDEVAAYQSVDNFVLRLNHSERNSLLENKGKFTLVVATFAGKTGMETPIGSAFKGYQFTVDDDLDIAAQEARDLAATMRQVENVDAYVWHDRYQSVVTVGAFSSANDPTIKPLRARYGARQSVNALVTQFNNSVQVLAIDAQGRKIPFDSQLGDEGGLATGSTTLPAGFRIWAFDPNPQLMAVPRTR